MHSIICEKKKYNDPYFAFFMVVMNSEQATDNAAIKILHIKVSSKICSKSIALQNRNRILLDEFVGTRDQVCMLGRRGGGGGGFQNRKCRGWGELQ